MSTTTLANSIQALRTEASNIIGHYNYEKDAIRQDRRLSPEGKDEQLSSMFASVSTRAKALSDKENKLLADELERLQRSLVTQLGSGSSDVIAMRDAEDRADRLENAEEAGRVLERALRGNDRSLAHAILRRASDAGWRDVVAQAAAAYPAAGQTLRDIQEINATLNDMGPLLHRAMAYGVSK